MSLSCWLLAYSPLIQADAVTTLSSALDGFDRVLSGAVDNGEVNYQKIKDNEDFEKFITFIAEFDATQLNNTEEKLVFYINAYNALSIKGILEGRSPSSFFGRIKFFKTTRYALAGQKLDLYALEHKIIRKLGDPRIHFAIVCASKSCPALRAEAYRLETLQAQLEDNARDFINDSFKNRFDIPSQTAEFSEILKWFKEDFETAGQSVQHYIAQYVNNPEIARLLTQDQFKITYIKYDWHLNGYFE